jgi:hypothetical protein
MPWDGAPLSAFATVPIYDGWIALASLALSLDSMPDR